MVLDLQGAFAPIFFGTRFALGNRRKSLHSKGLRRRGPPLVAVSPYISTTYIKFIYPPISRCTTPSKRFATCRTVSEIYDF